MKINVVSVHKKSFAFDAVQCSEIQSARNLPLMFRNPLCQATLQRTELMACFSINRLIRLLRPQITIHRDIPRIQARQPVRGKRRRILLGEAGRGVAFARPARTAFLREGHAGHVVPDHQRLRRDSGVLTDGQTLRKVAVGRGVVGAFAGVVGLIAELEASGVGWLVEAGGWAKEDERGQEEGEGGQHRSYRSYLVLVVALVDGRFGD
jgi:hypothetical protein